MTQSAPRELTDALFDAVARYCALLADPTRLRIVHTICQDEKPVTRIVAEAGATQTNVSRHLSLLHRAGVVARRRQGAQVWYRVSDAAFTEICRAACVRVAAGLDTDRGLRRRLDALIADLGEVRRPPEPPAGPAPLADAAVAGTSPVIGEADHAG